MPIFAVQTSQIVALLHLAAACGDDVYDSPNDVAEHVHAVLLSLNHLGNEGATERAMYRQYVIDSLKYWVNEYHVDGFRFDLMGLMVNIRRLSL